MTEPIKIDGVDVSGCYYYNNGNCKGCYALEKDHITLYGKCDEINDCHYKQLQRKTAENLKLINKNNLIEAELNQVKLLLEGKNTQYEQKRIECEREKTKSGDLLLKLYATERCDIASLYDKLQIATEALENSLQVFDRTDNIGAYEEVRQALEMIKE